jgi:hypothetical protein
MVFVPYICKKTHYMKHSLLISALAATLLFSNDTHAKVPGADMVPKLTIGIKAGVNMQSLTGATWKSAYNAGIVGGAFVGVTKNKIGVEGEVLVKSAKFNTNGGGGYINSVSLDVPVLFEYKIISRLWVQLGPQFSSMLSAKDNNSNDVKKSFNTTDFAGVIGLQANLPLHLTVGARYVLGMTNINNESVSGTKESWNNRSIQIYVGFRFI